jgi:Protein of unknown function (DUF2955)
MSTDCSSASRQRFRLWTNDLHTARILRYAITVTAAVAISFSLAWPLYFLTPVLVSVFMPLPLPAPTLKVALSFILYVIYGFLIGLVMTLFVLPYPLVFVPILGWILFQIYYFANRGGSFILVLMCLLGVLMLPMLGMQYDIVASGFAFYFIISGALAVVFYMLGYVFFPDPPTDLATPPRREMQKGYSRQAAVTAFQSTCAVLPLAVLFLSLNLSSQILIMIMAAIFSLMPEVAKGTAMAMKTMTSTLIGGTAAIIFFFLIVAVPELHFFTALMFFFTLVFAMGMFSEKSYAVYLGSAVTTLIVLLGSSMGEGASITGVFFSRVVLISGATLYIVIVMTVVEHLWSRKTPR